MLVVAQAGMVDDFTTVDWQLLRYRDRQVQQRIPDSRVVSSPNRGSPVHSTGRTKIRKRKPMNGQYPEVEPPGWNELGYGIYQGALFAIAIALIMMLVLLPLLSGAAIRDFSF